MFSYKSIFIYYFLVLSVNTQTENNTTSSVATTTNQTTNSTLSTATTAVFTSTIITTSTFATTAITVNPCQKNSTLCNYNGDCEYNSSKEIACKCFNNFEGTNCEYQKCQLNNEANQCVYGYCIENFSNKLDKKCKCNESYTGALCEKPLCIGYCYNDGICSFNENLKTRKCVCQNRFYGDLCQFDYCFNSKCPDNCYLYRTNNDTCKCSCDTSCDADLCFSKGLCQNIGNKLTCKCNVGFSGPRCQTDDCRGYCFNDGICLKNQSQAVTCVCPPDYEGIRCEKVHTIISPHRSSVLIYLIVVSILVCIIAIGTYIYKNGGMQFLRQQYENVSYRLRAAYQRAPQGGSRIPYVQTSSKSNEDLYTDPFS